MSSSVFTHVRGQREGEWRMEIGGLAKPCERERVAVASPLSPCYSEDRQGGGGGEKCWG
jgi:hypothetical protein